MSLVGQASCLSFSDGRDAGGPGAPHVGATPKIFVLVRSIFTAWNTQPCLGHRAPSMRRSSLEVRISRASAVVVQHVPAPLVVLVHGMVARSHWGSRGLRQLSWHRCIPPWRQRARRVGGGDPAPAMRSHFKGGWIRRFVPTGWRSSTCRLGTFELKALPGGFGSWFAGQTRGPAHSPSLLPGEDGPGGASRPLSHRNGAHALSGGRIPRPWTSLGHADRQRTERFHSPVGRDAGLYRVLCLLAQGKFGRQRAISVGGSFLIVVLLAGWALLFRHVTG